jgi:N-methylhydantoinase A
LKLGVDVGGTFTDLFAYDDEGERRLISKVPSTPDDFTLGVIRAISNAGIDTKYIDFLIHGSTIATNATIERTYPVTPFITTKGFRDLMLIGRYHRKSLYDPYQKAPTPFVGRRHLFEISERIESSGGIIEALNTKEAESISKKIRALQVSSVSVGFMNSYVNSVHEEKMKNILETLNPGIFVSLSSTIPKIRSLGRFATAILRACLQPVVKDYLNKLMDRLSDQGFSGRLLIVTNNGGMIDGKLAVQRPELMLTSGPASGVNAALSTAESIHEKNLITIDMGGTSCDVSIIENGQPLITSEYEIEWDYPVIVPMLDIRTIGAGGGSIAWIDEGGSIRVGPRSAGSVPGPACYGRGGTKPTVTDANLLLGRISPKQVFGNEIRIDLEAGQAAIKTVADQIGLDLIKTASGIITIVNENMAASLKQVSLDRGRDPRDFSLVAFGGAGPMHAAFLAKTMGIRQVIIPRDSGVFSAYGGVMMDFKHDYEKTFYSPIQGVDLQLLNRQYQELDQKTLNAMREQGVANEKVKIIRSAQIRYIGQTYEVETPVPCGEIGVKGLEEILSNFHNEHAKEYGFSEKRFPTAFVNLRSTAIGVVDKPKFGGLNSRNELADNAHIENRDVFFEDYGFITTEVFDRKFLPTGFRIKGPAVVEDISSTTVIPPEMQAEIDGYGNLIVSVNC